MHFENFMYLFYNLLNLFKPFSIFEAVLQNIMLLTQRETNSKITKKKFVHIIRWIFMIFFMLQTVTNSTLRFIFPLLQPLNHVLFKFFKSFTNFPWFPQNSSISVPQNSSQQCDANSAQLSMGGSTKTNFQLISSENLTTPWNISARRIISIQLNLPTTNVVSSWERNRSSKGEKRMNLNLIGILNKRRTKCI